MPATKTRQLAWVVLPVLGVLFAFGFSPAGETGNVDQRADDVEKLVRERIGVLEEIVTLQRHQYRHGEGGVEAVLAAEREVLTAKLELAKTRAERIALLEHQLRNAQDLEKITQRLFEVKQANRVDLLKAKALRLQAEAELLRARAGKAK
jgi:outer membrane protein TolC